MNYLVKKGVMYVRGWGEMGHPKRKQFLWTTLPENAWVFTPELLAREDVPDLPEGAKKIATNKEPHY